MGFLWPSNHSQVDCGLGDHFATTVSYLWASCALSVAFVFQHLRLYNNDAKIFGAEGVLCRRLENLDRKVTYKACESSYVISTSAWVYFFEKSFRVPKVVPKNGYRRVKIVL